MMNRTLAVLVLGLAVTGLLVAADAQVDGSDGSSPVYIEDSPAAQELISRAEAMSVQGRSMAAVQQLQQVIEQYPHKLTPSGDHLYMDISRWVDRYIRKRPALLKTYRQSLGPTAQRALAQATTPRADAAALAKVLSTYRLTRSGLEAGLDLAAIYLEQGDGRTAAAVLDTLAAHPDRGDFARRYNELQAVAAILDGDQHRAAVARARLQSLGFTAAASAIESLARHAPETSFGKSPRRIHLPSAAAFTRPLWAYRFSRQTSGTDLVNEAVGFGRLGASSPGYRTRMEPTPIPVAHRDALFVNDCRFIEAFDVDSGRKLWKYQAASRIDSRLLPLLSRMGRIASDARGVAVLGERVFAVVGRTTIWPGQALNANTGKTALVSLDRRTGRRLWRVTPGRVDTSFQKAAFHGTPIASGRQVFVMMRREQASGFRDAFVLAFAVDTGRLLWQRHIASTAVPRRRAYALQGRMILVRGRLYVTDGQGVVACLSARTGIDRWVRVLQGAADRPRRLRNERQRFSAFGPPVLVKAGLVVPASPGNAQPLLLDSATGQQRRALTGSPWDRKHYLVAVGGDLLAVGRKMVLLDGENLKPRWTATLGHAGSDVNQAVSGHPALVGDVVVVPTTVGLITVRLRDGKIIARQPISNIGNILALPDQLVSVTASSIESYMSWPDAERHLARRIAAAPLAVRPALDLASLALITHHDRAVLSAVDHALAVLDHASVRLGDAQLAAENSAAFDAMWQLTENGSGADRSLRAALFERLAAIAVSPDQQVRYHLGAARFDQSVGRANQAAVHYQTVLAQPDLASQLYHADGAARTAGHEARRRLRLLIDREGSQVYDRYRRQAQVKFQVLADDSSTSVEQLIALAAHYPFAAAAIRARLVAAARLEDAGALRRAIVQLRWAYADARDTPQQAAAVGALAQLYQQAHEPRRALAWLDRVSQEHPSLQPIRLGQPTSISDWQAQLRLLASAGHALPRLPLPLHVIAILPGRVIPQANESSSAGASGDRLLLRDAGKLVLRAGPRLAVRWRSKLTLRDPALLEMTRRSVLLFSPTTGALLALDIKTGKSIWHMPDVARWLDQAGTGISRAGQQAQARFTHMVQIAPLLLRHGRLTVQNPKRSHGYLIGVSAIAVCIADHRGRIVAIDPDTGHVLWRANVAMDNVTHLAINNQAVVLAGVSGMNMGVNNGSFVALDLLTGERNFHPIESDQPADWLGLGGRGMLFKATEHHLAAYQWLTGRLVWRRELEGSPLTDLGWAGRRQLVVMDRAGFAVCFDPVDGRTLSRVSLYEPHPGSPDHGRFWDGRGYLFSSRSAVAINADGTVHWRDAISLPGKHLVRQLLSRDHLLLIHQQGRKSTCRLYVLDRDNGRIMADYALGRFPSPVEPTFARLGGDHVILPLKRGVAIFAGSSPVPDREISPAQVDNQ